MYEKTSREHRRNMSSKTYEEHRQGEEKMARVSSAMLENDRQQETL